LRRLNIATRTLHYERGAIASPATVCSLKDRFALTAVAIVRGRPRTPGQMCLVMALAVFLSFNEGAGPLVDDLLPPAGGPRASPLGHLDPPPPPQARPPNWRHATGRDPA
jgi:hypothetical protein